MGMLRQLTRFKWWTTPAELRAIANKMEQKAAELTIGDDNLIALIEDGEIELEIRLDQPSAERKGQG